MLARLLSSAESRMASEGTTLLRGMVLAPFLVMVASASFVLLDSIPTWASLLSTLATLALIGHLFSAAGAKGKLAPAAWTLAWASLLLGILWLFGAVTLHAIEPSHRTMAASIAACACAGLSFITILYSQLLWMLGERPEATERRYQFPV